MSVTDEHEQLISSKELMRRLDLKSRTSLYRLGLTSSRFGVFVGNRWRFSWSAVLQHLREQTGTAGDGR